MTTDARGVDPPDDIGIFDFPERTKQTKLALSSAELKALEFIILTELVLSKEISLNAKQFITRCSSIATPPLVISKSDMAILELAPQAHFEKTGSRLRPGLMTRVGVGYVLGESVPRDLDKARILLESAAQSRDGDAMYMMGALYQSSGIGSGYGWPPDNAKVLRSFEKAAEAGHEDGMALLGALYMEGEGVAQNFEEASG